MLETHKRTLVKTIIWRMFNFVYWPIIGYIMTGTWQGAGYLGIGALIGVFLYYGYERIWANIKWGTKTPKNF